MATNGKTFQLRLGHM